MKKPLFSEERLPMLLASLSVADIDQLICTIRHSIYDGADGFLLHMEKMDDKFINEDSLARAFNYLGSKPLYTMNYRLNEDKDDDQRMAEQVLAIKAGASMVDMMGDMYDPAPLELTMDKKAILKQQRMIEKIHGLGGEVLMSSHTWVYMTTEEVLAHTKELEKRGADFIKIAMRVNNEDEAAEAMKTTVVVSRELKVPFLHICMGQPGKLHRSVGPFLGSCFGLCVQEYKPASLKDKPLLKAQRAVMQNIDVMMARDHR